MWSRIRALRRYLAILAEGFLLARCASFCGSRGAWRATLDAYAAGKIDLGKVPKDTRSGYILYAPYVTPQNENEGERPYTKTMLAVFLGWTKGKLLAERRLGEALAKIAKQHGSRGVGKKVELHDATSLSDLGITKTHSHRWQKLAT